MTATSCSLHEIRQEKDVRISFSGSPMPCRSSDPDEDMISDISLIIFDEGGSAEDCFRLEGRNRECTARLIIGKKYIFCACANFGYHVYADNIEELDEIRYHLAYPDEYSRGIPMYAYQEIEIREGVDEVAVTLERLMSKISLRIDRRNLSEDVEMYVRSVQIGNCPRSTNVFKANKVSDKDECFPAGFSRYGHETDNLNTITESGLSKSISLYMLENMQGTLDNIKNDSDKVFGKDDYRSQVCSYMEIELEYQSENHYSIGDGLIYRFYLGEGRNDLNIRRNCHYQITVSPEDDGLSDDGWRVDKSNLAEYGPTSFMAYPSGYINGDIGDEVHLWCEFSPANAPFDVGIGYMEDDKASGIYDYVIDDDGHGAVLTLTGPGTGLIYMEAGPPVNDAALFIIEVNQQNKHTFNNNRYEENIYPRGDCDSTARHLMRTASFRRNHHS